MSARVEALEEERFTDDDYYVDYLEREQVDCCM